MAFGFLHCIVYPTISLGACGDGVDDVFSDFLNAGKKQTTGGKGGKPKSSSQSKSDHQSLNADPRVTLSGANESKNASTYESLAKGKGIVGKGNLPKNHKINELKYRSRVKTQEQDIEISGKSDGSVSAVTTKSQGGASRGQTSPMNKNNKDHHQDTGLSSQGRIEQVEASRRFAERLKNTRSVVKNDTAPSRKASESEVVEKVAAKPKQKSKVKPSITSGKYRESFSPVEQDGADKLAKATELANENIKKARILNPKSGRPILKTKSKVQNEEVQQKAIDVIYKNLKKEPLEKNILNSHVNLDYLLIKPQQMRRQGVSLDYLVQQRRLEKAADILMGKHRGSHTLKIDIEGNNYQVLGIKSAKRERDITEAYSRVANIYHPDRYKLLSHSVQAKMKLIFQRIGKAKNELLKEFSKKK